MKISIGPTSWQADAALSWPLGCFTNGGRLICKSGGVAWIVAPNTTEVSRDWYNRDDAVTTAQSTSGCTGWFVPTCGQLQNPGHICRTYWDSYSLNRYWSSTQYNSPQAWRVYFQCPNGFTLFNPKVFAYCVRAFRCVTY